MSLFLKKRLRWKKLSLIPYIFLKRHLKICVDKIHRKTLKINLKHIILELYQRTSSIFSLPFLLLLFAFPYPHTLLQPSSITPLPPCPSFLPSHFFPFLLLSSFYIFLTTSAYCRPLFSKLMSHHPPCPPPAH